MSRKFVFELEWDCAGENGGEVHCRRLVTVWGYFRLHACWRFVRMVDGWASIKGDDLLSYSWRPLVR